MRTTNITKILFKQNVVFGIVIFLSILASIQSYKADKQAVDPGGPLYNHYNNYSIYKQSFFHLINGQDLYVKYPDEHWDLYKYTPTFSVFFGAFAFLPDWLGLNLWNLLNALVLLFAIYYLPRKSLKEKVLIVFVVLIELVTALQNEQSNALMAGMIVLSFGLLERKHYFFASFFLVFTVFIKLFGLVGFALLLLYPEKRKFVQYAFGWFVLFLLIPLIFISPTAYIQIYESFWHMLQADHMGSAGLSVMSWLQIWFGLAASQNLIVVLGVSLFLVPLARIKAYQHKAFRLLLLSSILLWVVIFNHKAESPTFIIAMTGVALWFVSSKRSKTDIAVLLSAILFTSLSPSDLFPANFRESFLIPYVIKAVPCILIWSMIIFRMLTMPFDSEVKESLLN